jgi:hypothetical protein
MKTSKTKTKKRPTEDEKEKIKSAVEELMEATKKFTELNVPINMVFQMVREVYAAQEFLSMLTTLKNELKRSK